MVREFNKLHNRSSWRHEGTEGTADLRSDSLIVTAQIYRRGQNVANDKEAKTLQNKEIYFFTSCNPFFLPRTEKREKDITFYFRIEFNQRMSRNENFVLFSISVQLTHTATKRIFFCVFVLFLLVCLFVCLLLLLTFHQVKFHSIVPKTCHKTEKCYEALRYQNLLFYVHILTRLLICFCCCRNCERKRVCTQKR